MVISAMMHYQRRKLYSAYKQDNSVINVAFVIIRVAVAVPLAVSLKDINNVASRFCF